MKDQSDHSTQTPPEPSSETSAEDQPSENSISQETTIIWSEEPLKTELSLEAQSFAATALEHDSYQTSVKQGRRHERYQVQDILDVGGTGVVFRVLDLDLHRPLAMKVLLPARKNHVSTIDGFVKEAKIHGLLEHPNIIPLHEFGCLNETGLFFTMKQVRGETLTEILTAIKRGNSDYLQQYTTYSLLSIFRKVCDAVAYAHSLGIIHQDIKPDNIIVGPYGEVFLIDWGAARFVGDPDQESLPATHLLLKDIQAEAESTPGKPGRLQGTPSFMSPEQAGSEGHEVDIRSDIFLLGATLYTIFTLKLPYMGKTVSDVLKKAKTRKLILPDQRSPERLIPEEICRIILKAMAYYKTDRYQTVEALAHDLDQVIAGRWLQQETRKFRTGDTLMQEGDVGEEAYLILDGSVLITKERGGTSVVLGIYQEGDIIGEMSLISEEPRSATVQALEETTVAVLTKEILKQHFKNLPPYMEKMISALTARLQHTDSMIHPHLASDCTVIVLKQLRLLFNDRFGDQAPYQSIPFQEIINEISQDLGIPQEKIHNVLMTAIHLKLLLLTHEQTLRIPNIQKLIAYTTGIKKQSDEPQE